MDLDHLLPSSTQAPQGTIYSYIDGSANTYYITTSLIQYDPMTRKWSSSGFYSGGEPATVRINSEQFERIKVILEQAIQNTQDHIANRVKMSGLLYSKKNNNRYILGANTTSLQAIEAILAHSLKQ
ncbi:hypothetical protein [Aureispira anguillae]|uniref:Uncharacterized protein n=1 Tax=Aureispira anguillae TaxID=2864201 RepID=A0A916DV65_9BACT|nr:hypothetical protein [Aureispira anguillae]BDS12836.1 hypothetical protein AsAng_0035610 [Aureispira anguillae]